MPDGKNRFCRAESVVTLVYIERIQGHFLLRLPLFIARGEILTRMAPTIGKRPAGGTRRSKPSFSKSLGRDRKGDELFSTTKKDKRIIKHSALVSRIEKSKGPSKKRRRPSKKLVTTLESLADALPDTTDDTDGTTVVGDAKIKHKSLRSRPGAMKKKEALISLEKERFNKNMAQMAALQPVGGTTVSDDGPGNGVNSIGKRWAALRGFIQQTTEQKT